MDKRAETAIAEIENAMFAAVIRAFVAEHPADDDEPVTEEWLRSIGFGPCSRNGQSKLIDTYDKNYEPMELYLDEDCSEWIASVLQGNGNDHVLLSGKHYNARGDVRRLCRALGVELKEASVPK